MIMSYNGGKGEREDIHTVYEWVRFNVVDTIKKTEGSITTLDTILGIKTNKTENTT